MVLGERASVITTIILDLIKMSGTLAFHYGNFDNHYGEVIYQQKLNIQVVYHLYRMGDIHEI
jgi:hypothetical protein